jgi:hypothetical protein
MDLDVPTLAQTNQLEVVRAYAALPTSSGGLGFTRLSKIAAAAYTASVDSAASGGNREKVDRANTQRARTITVNEEYKQFIRSKGPQYSRHLEYNSRKGTALFLRDPTIIMSNSAWRMQMAFRCLGLVNGLADTLNTSDGLCCPGHGCKQVFKSHVDFLFHAAYCAQVSGHNVSAGHAHIKKELLQILHELHFTVDANEPRDVRLVTCPGCKNNVSEAEWPSHKKGCACCSSHTEIPRGSGPDIRIRTNGVQITKGKLNFQPEACNVDVTQVGSRCNSNINAEPNHVFDKRTAEKHNKYGAGVTRNNQELIAFCVNEDGHFNAEAERLLDYIAKNASNDIRLHSIRRRMQVAAQVAHGNALVNVAKHIGLNSIKKFNDTPLARDDRMKKIRNELSLINADTSITPENRHTFFATSFTDPEATNVLMRRKARTEDSEQQAPTAPPRPTPPTTTTPTATSSNGAATSANTLVGDSAPTTCHPSISPFRKHSDDQAFKEDSMDRLLREAAVTSQAVHELRQQGERLACMFFHKVEDLHNHNDPNARYISGLYHENFSQVQQRNSQRSHQHQNNNNEVVLCLEKAHSPVRSNFSYDGNTRHPFSMFAIRNQSQLYNSIQYLKALKDNDNLVFGSVEYIICVMTDFTLNCLSDTDNEVPARWIFNNNGKYFDRDCLKFFLQLLSNNAANFYGDATADAIHEVEENISTPEYDLLYNVIRVLMFDSNFLDNSGHLTLRPLPIEEMNRRSNIDPSSKMMQQNQNYQQSFGNRIGAQNYSHNNNNNN